MKFVVTRTSEWNHDTAPCEEAYQETVIYTDVRTVNDPAKIPLSRNQSPNWWYEAGTNHRRLGPRGGGNIARDFAREVWMVDIETMDDLMKFIEKYGNVVIEEEYYFGNEYPRLEIYDNYRE